MVQLGLGLSEVNSLVEISVKPKYVPSVPSRFAIDNRKWVKSFFSVDEIVELVRKIFDTLNQIRKLYLALKLP